MNQLRIRLFSQPIISISLPLVRSALALVAGLSCLWSSPSLAAPADSCSIAWDAIQQVSHDSANSWAPQVLAVGDTVHVLWFGDPATSASDSGLGIQYAHSFDGGRTFSAQRRLVTWDSARGGKGFLAASGSIVYMMYSGLVGPPSYSYLALLRSTDAGNTWEPRRLFGDAACQAIAAHGSDVYMYFNYSEGGFARNGMFISHDYGAAWDTVRINIRRTSVSRSLAVDGNALHLLRSVGITGYQEVFYNRSTDFGFTWTEAETLSVDDGLNSQVVRLASDGGGNLYAVWNDQKYGGNFSGTIVMRRSTDYGVTWLPEQIISQLATAVFCDVAVENKLVLIGWDTEVSTYTGKVESRLSKDGGETFCPARVFSPSSYSTGNVSVFLSQRIGHAAWVEGRESTTSEISYARTASPITMLPEESATPRLFSLLPNYPNPFNNETTIAYLLPANEKITLQIFDILGRLVTTLVAEEQSAGTHSLRFRAEELSSGMYYAVLRSIHSTPQTRGMILVR